MLLDLERVVDPLMFDHPKSLLWAYRRAQAVSDLAPLPRFDGLGAYFGPSEPTNPNDVAFPDISDLVPLWQDAAVRCNRAALERLAERSALRTAAERNSHPPKEIAVAGNALGALCMAIAHSGSAVTWLYAPGALPKAAAALSKLGGRRVMAFRTGGAG